MKILKYKSFINEKISLNDANEVLNIIKKNISTKAELIGGFGKGKVESDHDIDILIPDKKFNKKLKDKIFKMLNAKTVEDTDWGGWYFSTKWGDVDIFYTTKDFDY